MNCSKCGENLGEKDMFCPRCGTPVQKTNEENADLKNENMYSYERPMNQQANTQNYNQPNNYGQQNNNKDSKSVVKTCIIIVIVVAITAAMGFFIYSVISAFDKNKKNDDQELKGGNVQETTNTYNQSSNTVTPVSNTQKSSTYKVNYAGFKLYIPDDLMYEIDSVENSLNIGDSISTWIARLNIQNLSFQRLKQNKNNLSNYLTEALSGYGAKISNANVETIDGVEFIWFEAELGGAKEIFACAELNSMYTAIIDLFNENNDYDKNLLKNLTPILKTAEYTGETNNLKTNTKINMNDINKALEKAVGE